MTPFQQATVAFLASVIRKGKYSRNFNVRVYLISQRDYMFAFRDEFTPDTINLKIEPNDYRIRKDELELQSSGRVKLKVIVEDKFSTKIEMRVNPREMTFEGRVDNGKEFRAQFDGSDVVKISDPDKGNTDFAYRVELY